MDIVYLWCDLQDAAFRAKRAEALRRAGIAVNEGDNGACRYRSNDELRYSLRSLERFAPWLDAVHIVIDDAISPPAWLKLDAPRLRLHRWSEAIPPEKLPCFNSSALEFFIQDIPGLSERFLYANDDMLFARPLEPSFFFAPDGWPIYRYSTSRLDMAAPTLADGYLHRVRESFRFAKANFGVAGGYKRAYGRLGHHNIDPYVKADLLAFREAYPAIWDMQTSFTFRDRRQLQREVLAGWAFSRGHAHFRSIKRPWWQTAFGLPHRDSWHCIPVRDDIAAEFARLKPSLVCMNDSPEVTDEGRKAATRFLETLLPGKSSFETD